jgi:hypothetical protein
MTLSARGNGGSLRPSVQATTRVFFTTVICAVSVSCAGEGGVAAPSTVRTTPPTPHVSSNLSCPDGEEPREAGWDYGADPRGFVTDPVAWVRKHARGLDPGLDVSLIDASADLEDVVVATTPDGTVLAYVDFNKDDTGRYLPVVAKACRASKIEDFT